ncbi:MAG: ABC transporter permease [Bacilli bacterium]
MLRNRKKKVLNSSKNWRGGWLYKLYVILIVIFFYAPIISIMVFSFNSGRSATNFESFSTVWYQELLENDTLLNSLGVTISIALIATIVSTIIGTLGAISLANVSKNHKVFTNFVLNVNNIPIVNPDIVTAVSLMVLFMAVSSVLSMGYITMLLAHIAFCTPYVIIQVYPKVLRLDKNLIEAAMDLGASRKQAIYKVMLPELRPAIISGALMAFTMSFDDFIISYFVGGQTQNISIYIYSMKRFNPVVNALSTIIFLVIVIVFVGIEIFRSKHSNYDEEGNSKRYITFKEEEEL